MGGMIMVNCSECENHYLNKNRKISCKYTTKTIKNPINKRCPLYKKIGGGIA